jgi:hypothetical protein
MVLASTKSGYKGAYLVSSPVASWDRHSRGWPETFLHVTSLGMKYWVPFFVMSLGCFFFAIGMIRLHQRAGSSNQKGDMCINHRSAWLSGVPLALLIGGYMLFLLRRQPFQCSVACCNHEELIDLRYYELWSHSYAVGPDTSVPLSGSRRLSMVNSLAS